MTLPAKEFVVSLRKRYFEWRLTYQQLHPFDSCSIRFRLPLASKWSSPRTWRWLPLYSLLRLRLRTDIKWLRWTCGENRLCIVVRNLVRSRNADQLNDVSDPLASPAFWLFLLLCICHCELFIVSGCPAYENDWQLEKLKPVVDGLRVSNGFSKQANRVSGKGDQFLGRLTSCSRWMDWKRLLNYRPLWRRRLLLWFDNMH